MGRTERFDEGLSSMGQRFLLCYRQIQHEAPQLRQLDLGDEAAQHGQLAEAGRVLLRHVELVLARGGGG